MRILIRTSRLASWARRFGSFALPLAVIPVFLHRAGIMDSETFGVVEGLALLLALAALGFGVAACVRLWFTGDRGWARAITGIVLGLLCLSPLAYGAYLFRTYPATTDIVSDAAIPVELMSVPARDEQVVADDAIRMTFPDIGPREYQLGTNDLYRVVNELIAQRGWTVLRRQVPQLEDATGQINAVHMTWLGWRDEIAVRMIGSASGTRVAVRSASRTGSNDLGMNGRRVNAFLADLDAAVRGALLNQPDADSPPVPVIPRPAEGSDG